ncbi:MAG: FMN-binding negative transcriptional regulator [Chitinophagaceae bacterium]|nr:FMN-binding negative transcriptional regulator [Chitinophagaceae bacterium]
MYDLPYFKENDPEVVKQFVREHPFAFVTGCNAQNEPAATQIPVFIDEREGKLFLSGHMMRNTDHQKAFLQNPNVLAVFTGAHTYVSASWYENKQQGSTWNYMSVHARGVLRFLDEQALKNVLKRTTNHFENNPHSGANFEDLPEEYVEKMIRAIVAFEIEVKELDNVFKLSQNRDSKSYDTITEKLKQQGGDGQEIAELMEKRRSKLFPS